MSGRKITNADLEALKAAVVFARNEADRDRAQRELDLTMELVAATSRKPSHRPTNRDAKKAAMRCFLALVRQNWERIDWTCKDTRIGAWAKRAAGNENGSHAFSVLLAGAEFLVEDRLFDDEPLDEFHLLKAVELIETNRRTNRRRKR